MSPKRNPWSEGPFIVAERSLAVSGAEWKINIRPDFKLTGLTITFVLVLPQKFRIRTNNFIASLDYSLTQPHSNRAMSCW